MDVNEVNAYYRQQLDGLMGRHDKEALDGAPQNMADAANFIDLTGAKQTFCGGWAEVEKDLAPFTWIPFIGKYIVMAIALMNTADRFFVSGFCASQPAPTSASTATLRTNVSQKAR